MILFLIAQRRKPPKTTDQFVYIYIHPIVNRSFEEERADQQGI